MTFLWIKQSVKLFLMLFKTPYRETLARSIIPFFLQWVQASSKGSPPRGLSLWFASFHYAPRVRLQTTLLLSPPLALDHFRKGLPD
jgi:hypothetical protein